MKTIHPLPLSVAVLLMLPALLACGESAESLDASAVEPAVSVGGNLIPTGAPLVDQRNLKFNPSSLKVSAGATIYLRNDETAIHTVTINGQNVTGDMRRDEVMAWTIATPGTYKFTCDYHPQMKATITVE